MELSPEDRQRIYEEERARHEARAEFLEVDRVAAESHQLAVRAELERQLASTATIARPLGKFKQFAMVMSGSVVLGIGFFVFGVLLSLSGIFAFLGIPMIFGSIGIPVWGAILSLSKMDAYEGPCPYCGKKIPIAHAGRIATCRNCKQAIAVVPGEFRRSIVPAPVPRGRRNRRASS